MSRAAPGLRKLSGEATCLAIAFMVVASCSDAGNGARTSEPRVPDRWSIEKAGANVDLQRDSVLSMIAQLAVLVRMNDRAAGAATVTWRVLLDTAVVTTSPTTTDRAGMATFQFILGPTAGNYTVEASLDSAVSSGARVTFSIVATPGNATTLAIQSGADQTDTATAQLQADYVVRLSDAHGNGVPGTVVSWAVTSGGGSISPPMTLTTAPNGEARARRQLGREVGPSSATAAALGLDAPVVFNATAVAAPPTRLTMVSGNGQVAQVNNVLGSDDVVRVSDTYGNGIAGVAIDWTIVSGGGSLSTTKTTTLADGSATVRSTLGPSAGTQTVSATANGLPNKPAVTFSATATAPLPPPPTPPPPPPPPPPPSTLTLVSGDGQTAEPGTTLSAPIVVMAADASGHALPNRAVTFTVTSGGGSVSPTAATTDVNGRAQTTWTLGATAGMQTLNVSAPAVTSTVVTVSATAGKPPLVFIGEPSYYYYYGSSPPSSVGIGQYTSVWVGPSTLAAVPSPLTVSLSHDGVPHTTVPSSVTIPTGDTFSQFQITGTSAGTDVIVASAPGYSAATLSISVGLGTISLAWSGSPKVGATNEAYLCVLSPDSRQVFLASPATLSIAPGSNIKFLSGEPPNAVITSVTIPADQNNCAHLFLQGLSAGLASVTITSPNYTTLTTSITVVP
jgi:hypothetical protein